MWCVALFSLIHIQRNIRPAIDSPLSALQRGFFALLLMGFVLHVFEDSMVNYLFFVVYGIVLGTLSRFNNEQPTTP
ncbi:MAG: hypothetical protein LBG52_00815 [Candidatus Peribacteria bacterium]|nr:hypothetical protein [Candidatus Peribacteria bacterium]